MPKEFSRKLRIEEMMQRELATLILQEIKDPRLGMVTVSGVAVSPDLRHAKIYVTILNNDGKQDDQANSVKILNRAAGFLRHELARRLYMKTTPDLRFVYDESARQGGRLAGVIRAAMAIEKQGQGQQS